MDTKYRLMYDSMQIVLSGINNVNYYVNTSEAIINYINYSNWYLIHRIRSAEMAAYEERLSSGKGTADYPTQPSGYQKQYRYADWGYKNYTKKTEVQDQNITLLQNGMVESLYAALTQYNVTYKYHEYYDEDGATKEAFKVVQETRLDYIHTLSFTCAPKLAITVYIYDYDMAQAINIENLERQIAKNRDSLTAYAGKIRWLCDSKYSDKVFTPG